MANVKLNNDVYAYVDGIFHLFDIEQKKDGAFSSDNLIDTGIEIWYEELSVSDKTKAYLQQNGVETTMKLRIAQFKKIDSKNVLLIDGAYHRVFNVYHFTNDKGMRQTDITLERYHYDKK